MIVAIMWLMVFGFTVFSYRWAGLSFMFIFIVVWNFRKCVTELGAEARPHELVIKEWFRTRRKKK